MLLWGLASTGAHAQLQRSFINPGFESPALPCVNTMVPAANSTAASSAFMPGWNTTDLGVVVPSQSCGLVTTGNYTKAIELWRSGFLGILSAEGLQFAELNANQDGRLYQEICLLNGDTITYSFQHRGRSGVDVASFGISALGTTANTLDTTFGTVSDGTAWGVHAGTINFTGTSGVYQFGFRAVSSSSGDPSYGNFLDAVQFSVKPVIQMGSTNVTVTEGQAATVNLLVSGLISAPMTVHLRVTGGTATSGADYTLPNGTTADFTVTVPAGNYDGTTPVPVAVATTLIDAVVDPNETIIVQLAPDPAYLISSTSSCGAAASTSATVTILEPPVDMVAAISFPANAPAGTTVTGTATCTKTASISPSGPPAPSPRRRAPP